jgi:hypothetical protein
MSMFYGKTVPKKGPNALTWHELGGYLSERFFYLRGGYENSLRINPMNLNWTMPA